MRKLLSGRTTKSCSVLVLASSLLLSACVQQNVQPTATSVAIENSAAEQLQSVIDESWGYRVSISPELALRLGDLSAAKRLPDHSAHALAEAYRYHEKYLAQLLAIDTKQLSQTERINHEVLRYQLQHLVDSYLFKTHLMPLSAEGGFHTDMGRIATRFTFDSEVDYKNYLHVLGQLPRYFLQEMAWLKQGLEEGYTQPKVTLRHILKTFTPYLQHYSKTPFYQPFKHKPEFITARAWQDLQDYAQLTLTEQVIPAYQELYSFMQEAYIPQARTSVAAFDLPQGQQFYANQVQYFATTDISIDAVHGLGLKEVARIRRAMQSIIQQLNFSGGFSDFLHFLRTDPQFYATSSEGLLKEAAWLAKKADAQLPKLFKTLPRRPYGVEAVPADIAPNYTTGRYVSASRDDQAAFYWVNTYALDKRPLYALPALTLHEAVPGHHLQIALSEEQENLPDFRRHSYISAFGEGWALYSEWLGVEMGMYPDLYSEFGRLSYEMWRACRLVVDTGLHAKGWTRQEAIAYLEKHTALSKHNVITEVDRYIGWPGQALSYKLGEITIKQLRQNEERRLGEQFDVREFHDSILKHGAVPLSVLRAQFESN